MLSLELSNNFDPDSESGIEWEDLLKRTPESGFMQSLYWARFKRKQKMQCFHLQARQDGKLVGGAMLYAPAAERRSSVLIAPEGPVLPWHDQKLSEEIMQLLLKKSEQLAESAGAMSLRIEPRLPEPAPAYLLAEFGRAPQDLLPRETLYLDLSAAEDEILAGMKAKGRYNISLARRNGVEVAQASGQEMLPAFYRIMREASQRDHFALEPLSYFEMIFESLPCSMVKLLFAVHEGEILGTLLLVIYGERATYYYGGISNKKRKLMAGYALQWRAIQIAKASGCKTYDFFGYDQFQSPANAYARFSQFKSKFGGTPRRFLGANEHFFTERLADLIVSVFKEIQENPSQTESGIEKHESKTHQAYKNEVGICEKSLSHAGIG